MWIVNFYKELLAWNEVRKVCNKNNDLLLKYGLKHDWFGRIYKVINRDVDIELGSEEDKVSLHFETAKIWNVLVRLNIADILAYELIPLNNVSLTEDGKEEYEHGYLIILTPAYNLEKQYVSFKNVFLLLFALTGIISLLTYIVLCF